MKKINYTPGFSFAPIDVPMLPEYVEEFTREIQDALIRRTGVLERAMLFAGYANTTARQAEIDATLTMEKLQQSMNKFQTGFAEAIDWAPGPPKVAREIFPVLNWPARGIQIFTSSWLGESVTPQPPPMTGPYQKRRLKRWYRTHLPYTRGNGQFLIVGKREIWCHPDDYYKLKAAIDERNAAVRPADKEA